jgi:hypothetical protein
MSASNPKGIAALSPGLRGTSYPGKNGKVIFNLNEVAAEMSG